MHRTIDTLGRATDERLVEMAGSGDSAAFDTLVRRFQRAVHAVAFAVVSDREAALDVLQESFIAAYRQLPSLEDPTRFGPWVCAIARNQAKQFIRGRARRGLREVALPDAEPAAQPLRAHAGIERIREAMSALTETQADVVTLFYMEGYSIAECARVLEVPEGTIKRRLHDARQRLKKEMSDMVRQHLKEFALREDHRVVIDEASRTHTTAPSIAWYKGRWVMVWQNGEPWEPYDGPFWFLLSESADGKVWSEPKRLAIEPQWQALPKLCALGDELVLHTHHHHYGLRLHRSSDLDRWVECPLIHAFDVGRSDVFSDGDSLFVTYPIWRPHDIGDAVEVIRSSDRGTSWTWLEQPFPSSTTGITDAAGAVIGGKIVVAWRGHDYPIGAGNPNVVQVCWSDDSGRSWSKPVVAGPLSTERGSFELQILPTPDRGLAVVQDVRDDYSAGEGVVWLAASQDNGATWPAKAIYSAGTLRDPAIAFAPDGTLLLAGSSRTGQGARPWVVKSHIEN